MGKNGQIGKFFMSLLFLITMVFQLRLGIDVNALPIRTVLKKVSHQHTCHRTIRPLFMSTETQRTIAAGSHESEIEVKKSRFIGYAKHAENWDAAQNYIQEIKRLHPKARHWCYGFKCGVNPVSERCSDDGEPTGTAGQPILGAINGEDLSDVICIVVRYFGGIKLGAGGLIRSYGAAARQVLREAPIDVLIPKSIFKVSIESSMVGSIYDCVAKAGGGTSGEEYDENGDLTVTITCDLEVSDKLCENLNDATRGSILFHKEDKD